MPELPSKYRDALRRGLQSAVAAGLFFAIARAYGVPEVFVGILSAVLILSASSDGSVKAASDRILSTVVGSAIAVTCVFTLPPEWGTLVALCTSVLVMGCVSVLRPNWHYGLVGTIALSMGTTHNLYDVTLDRLTAIAIGAVIGMIVSFTVWPDRAAARYRRHRGTVLRALDGRLARLEAVARGEAETVVSPDDDRTYHTAYGNLLDAKNAKTVGEIPGASDEVQAIRRVYNSIIILDRVLEDGARTPPDFADLIETVRAALQALSDRADAPTAGHIDCPVDTPELTTAAKFGMHELASEVRRLRKLQRSGT